MKNSLGYIIIAYLSLLCYGVLDNIRGPAYPSILSAFGLSLSKGSLFFAVSSLSGLPMVLFGNKWLKYIGELNGQRIFLILMSLGIFGIGVSGQINNGFPLMIISTIFLGLGFGGTTISSNILIANGCSEKNRRRIYSGMHAMYGLSSIIAPLLYSLAVVAGFAWMNLFIILSTVPIIVLLFTSQTTKIDHGIDRSSKPRDISFLKIILICLALSLYVACEVCISSRLVLFVTRTQNISASEASIYLSIFFIMLFAGRFLFSIIHFKWSNYRLMMISNILSLILIIIGIFVHPIFLSVSALTMSYFFPYGMDWISKRFGNHTGYMITAVMIGVSAILFFMHACVGIVSDHLGIRMGVFCSAVFLLFSTILLFYLRGEFFTNNHKS